MDVFADDFQQLADEETTFSSKSDSSLKEYQSFTDLQFSKDKTITCIEWHPTVKGKNMLSSSNILMYNVYWACARVRVCVCMHVHVWMHACMRVCVCVCVCVCGCGCHACCILHSFCVGVVAVSCAERLSFDERINQSSYLITQPSLVLIWSFTDPIHPQVRRADSPPFTTFVQHFYFYSDHVGGTRRHLHIQVQSY